MKHTLKVSTPGDLEIVVTREFNAPRELVWEAMTTPALIKRWIYGPPGWEMTVCEDDPRAGGKFRWVWTGPEGTGMTMHGVYQEVVRPERGVRTEIFEHGCAPAGSEQLATLELADQGPRTGMTITVRFPSKEAREGAIAAGMARGMAASYDRLDEVLAEVAV